MMTKKLLAIDTSTENCSAALQLNGKLFTRVLESPREHSQRLLPFVQQLLDEAEASLKQLDGLAVGCGPGSFTGVRIGVSVAQGLAFSQQLPVYPVCTLQALAQQRIRRSNPAVVLACIDARMAEVYYALYENINGVATALTEPAVAKPDSQLLKQPLAELKVTDYGRVATAGSGWDNYADILLAELPMITVSDQLCRLPEAQDMLALVTAGQVQAVDASELEPLYVRNEVTWKKLPGR
ncbi:tRNA (adenosine(37)-N6)-threonylcarbamoyltransferase complex dimerization subunit type 1 TsaB [Idiomarina seosinensis]|nr:tRNA (adenosine(37)-N6)-threonylcarbamoyltransferase complex dimerization subunit type 1 TsaB [Idiomarina seosinensis]